MCAFLPFPAGSEARQGRFHRLTTYPRSIIVRANGDFGIIPD